MNELFPVLTCLNLDVSTRDELFDRIFVELEREGYVKPSFRKALEEREDAYPTGLRTTSVGVAIPHVDVEHVLKNAVLVVTLKNPIQFHEMGGAPHSFVNVECVLVILLNSTDKQLKLLMGFMDIVRNPADLLALRNAQDSPTAKTLLSQYIEAAMKRG